MPITTGFQVHRLSRLWNLASAFLFYAMIFPASASTQQAAPASPPTPANNNDAPEISQKDVATTFKVRVNQVLVRVVVRDSNGKAIPGLKREDFLLLDGGKTQSLTSFTEIKGGEPDPRSAAAPQNLRDENGEPIPAKPGAIPSRFIVYLFDDMHLSSGDLSYSRDAADEQIDRSLEWERMAVYTTSGLVRQEFTSDRAQLHAALKRIVPETLRRETESACPYMNYYFAYLLDDVHDNLAMTAAIQQTIQCDNLQGMPNATDVARMMVQSQMNQSLGTGGMDAKVLLSMLRSMVRMSDGVIGQRDIVLVSPGFFLMRHHEELTTVLEDALHSGVIINVLDARGLWTDPTYDASRSIPPGPIAIYIKDTESARSDSPSEIAYTTGGTFFHNQNDMKAGMRLLASAPESAYLLSFNPQGLKSDGKFHKIVVKLDNHLKYTVTARKGYYAPAKDSNPEAAARQQVEDTLFSQEELQEIPIEVHTQFYKPTDTTAKLSVVAHFSLQSLHFRREQDRNSDTLTEVCGIFDHNGQFVTGMQKTIDLRLREATLAKLNSGISVKSSLDVKPGSYLVRVVLRDKEGQMISARSIAVEIP